MKTLHPAPVAGFSLIEVLITILILGIGLLGLAGLQARAFNAEVESFSRSQALILANDMADRIASNREEAKRDSGTGLGSGSAYITSTIYGVPYTPGTACSSLPTGTSAQLAAKDLCEWSEALKGATQTSGGSKVGQLPEARGCIVYQAATAGPPAQPMRFRVVVAWQGRGGIGSVPNDLAAVNCVSAITPAGTRRAVSISVPFAELDA